MVNIFRRFENPTESVANTMVNAPRTYNQYEMINNLPKTKLDHDQYPTRWTKPGPYTGMQQTGICRLRKGCKNFLKIQTSDWLNDLSI